MEILIDDKIKTVYKIKSSKQSEKLGKYTNWCISKDDNLIPDVDEYYKQGYSLYFIKSKKEKNSAKFWNGFIYVGKPEWYAVLKNPDGEILEIINANNDNLLYIEKLEFVLNLLEDLE